MRLPYELFLALRYLRFHRGRTFLSVITLISVGGVCVGTAALVIALALSAGFVEDVRARIHSGSAHLTVMSSEESRFPQAHELARRTEALPGVEAAGAVLYTPAMLTFEQGGSTSFAELQGIDPEAHARVAHGEAAADSPFLALLGTGDDAEQDAERPGERRDGIVLGYELALSLGVIPGDRLRVIVPQATLSPWGMTPRSRLLEVVGTYRSEHFQQDSQRAYVTLAAAQRLLRAPQRASWVEVRVDDLRRIDQRKAELQATLGPPWLVVDLIEQNRDILRALNTEKYLLFLAIGLIVVVASMNIVSTLVLMVTDKIKEIGTLTAMGARAESIALVFMLQGLIIGIVGTAAGLSLGAVVAHWLDRLQLIRLDPEVYYLDHVPFALQPLDLVQVGVAALVISFLATIYPALKAAGLQPVEAIHHD